MLFSFKNQNNIINQVNIQYPKCKLCKPIISHSSQSSSKDLVLLFATDRYNRIEILARSLRSVGCLARIVVLVPLNANITQDLTDCGIEFVKIASVSSRLQRSPHKMRWEWYYQYLQEHLNEFDRILHTDAFDTYAQYDPFSNNIKNDTLYAISEDRPIKECIFNTKWLNSCYNNTVLEELSEKSILCSGTVIGGARQFMKLVETMVDRVGWDDCWTKAHDQPVFTYVIYNELIDSLKIEFLGCNSEFATMNYCYSEKKTLFYNDKLLKPNLIGYPSFVHQYNRYPEVDDHFQKNCNIRIDRAKEKKSKNSVNNLNAQIR
ncbi:hypothetical protein TVAG_020560 [Trichomonas vaginalis G3]|uniref:Uncharacterized protein n=1 Tax=Trichomonas vaginalis (strain ATCC PRA-98 / G3) TaxID=412133 RepID=A2EXX0_TRIV3|nr:hypothetical protein TVAGG3_0318020 [Trichomonas vaginalis G3]EAY02503.1 hypothetical protein TVAG_020560 [Trichomonas vaginalis G3]KAI5529079.1 hypothetical protein TVAGG3_0318020 [Trichomonas vaginalis G3]|eukprot:XP_001314742.1 hypothetical protein [Trichomonas vaginalis G3]